MAIPKVIGTETEYGIAAVGSPEFNPVISSSLLISTYAGALRRIRWDYEQESPLRDARGFEPVQVREPSEEDLGLANVILPNGARYYVDHAHPEYSTPECATAARAGDPRQGGGEDPRTLPGRAPARDPHGPAPRRLQEQQRRQRQLLRDPRELPGGSRGAVREPRAGPHPVLRKPAGHLRRGQAGCRGRLGRARPAPLPADPACGLLRGRGRPRDHAEAPHHQHARRAPRRSRTVPAAPRDRRRCQPVRGCDLPQGGDDGPRPEDDRG